jgi:PAS domain S-box-containing protein
VNYTLVSIIVPHHALGAAESQAIEGHVRASGLQFSLVKDTDSIDHIKTLTSKGQEPGVIIIGPGISHPIALARTIRAIWTVGQMLFVPSPASFEKARQELRHAPMIGPNWSLLEIEDPAFAKRIQRAVHSSQQRVRLRTTLDRANIKLSAPKPVDSLEYRRSKISEHYLANLLQESSDAIITLDTRDTVLYWSPAAERMFGLGGFAVESKAVSNLPFWSSSLDSYLEEMHSGRKSAAAEVKCSMGELEQYLEVSFSRVHDENNAFIGTSLTIRDISERNKLLEIERAARREAERMSRMKDEFLAILSHELRTPLSAVIGRAQLLKMQHRNAPELLSSLTVIERNAQLQAKLIEDLLDVSSIIAGKLHLDMQPISVAKLINTAIESVRTSSESKKIWVLEPPHVNDKLIQGDPYRLQQVLHNLLTNAIKFTPEGGQVQVHVTSNGPDIEITVQDNGVGISPDFLPMVFERFGQEDASITRRHGGLGLGLSIAKQLVELHGGAIRVASPGRNLGARFTVSLPILSDAQTSERPSVSITKTTENDSKILRNRRILVVEDVPDSRELVLDVLQTYGATVIAVESAEAALRSLETLVPDVLISDIGMPEMDGYELIKRIRSMGLADDKLPAIALTAFANPNDRARALMSGFQSHIAKPLIATDLVSAITRLIDATHQ